MHHPPTPHIHQPRIIRSLPPQIKSSLGFLLFNIAWTFVAGELTGNVSQVDRVWTFLPPLYTIYFTFYPLFADAPLGLKSQGVQPRAVLMTSLQLLWCLRLSYNTLRRGLFALSEEDYRWKVFRQKVNPTVHTVFNLLFIAGFQNILLYFLAIPTYTVSINNEPLHTGDWALAGLIVLAIGVEFTADNQQWAYHNFKNDTTEEGEEEWIGARLKFTPEDKQRGFITRGLWAYSRHPNVAAEQLIWFLMSLFPLVSHPRTFRNGVDMLALLSPSITLSILLHASTIFTESISEPKYVAYKYYQDRVGKFWPLDTFVKGLKWRVWNSKHKETSEKLLWAREEPKLLKSE